MTQEESIVAEAVAEKLEERLLWGEKGMPEKGSYLNDSWPTVSLRQQRKLKGTVVCCFVCGDSHTTLYKTGDGYICRTCRRKRDFK